LLGSSPALILPTSVIAVFLSLEAPTILSPRRPTYRPPTGQVRRRKTRRYSCGAQMSR
jgi:hypothetical protein